ncbi:glycosyltransferase family 39 protein [Gammaproteobacteria bacterium]|nr:glycosyltransferase family 39 protein [Gammaproteobacteria bacterium]
MQLGTPFRFYFTALLLGVLITGTTTNFSSPVVYRFTNDSSGYIENAINLANGNGLRGSSSAFKPEPYVPLRHHPPGYSISIALLTTLGVNPKTAALTLPFLGWTLLPIAILFAMAPWVGYPLALMIGVLAATSPGVSEFSLVALPDVFFMTLVVFSLGLLLRGIKGEENPRVIFISGCIAGLGYTLRNTGLPLFAAGLATFLSAFLLNIFSAKRSFHLGLTWFAGVAVTVVPLITRNLIVFGDVQPYQFDTIDFGYLRSLRLYLWSSFYDLTGFRFAADLAWDFKLFVIALAPLIAVILIITRYKDLLSNKNLQFTGLLLFFYLCAGSAMIIIVRARYPLSEMILIRHAMQYTWLIPALVAVLIAPIGLTPYKSIPAVTLAAFLSTFMVGHINYIASALEKENTIQNAVRTLGTFKAAIDELPADWILTNQIKLAISTNSNLLGFVRELPENAFITSNFSQVLKLETGRSVRLLDPNDESNDRVFFDRLNNLLATKDPSIPFYWILLPTNGMLRKNDNPWVRFEENLPKQLFTIQKTDSLWIVTDTPHAPKFDKSS